MPTDTEYKLDTELILAPGVFAFVLDATKGHINTLCGPIKQSLSNTDRLVNYDPRTARFVITAKQAEAIQTNVTAPKGYYVILVNPSATSKQPEPGKAEVSTNDTLRIGQVENLPGPQSFPLWPRQEATVVKGHHLRSNQYLLVRVNDDEAAKNNWDKSVVKSVQTEGELSTPGTQSLSLVLGIDKDKLVTGQLIIIKGTVVSFYIPSSGIEVLKDESQNYIRDAVTLERLEYSILLGESGNKEYKIGPDVVFPTPTQQFFTKDGNRKFRAFELQPTTGIHIKVIAEYMEGNNLSETGKKTYNAGDEMFITGVDMPIYYPRPEHAIISYGGYDKTFAVAVPGGEGRYVLNRQSGVIDLIEGPIMFLPNPIKQVVVRRALTDAECELYYPGNQEVLRINQALRSETPPFNDDAEPGGYQGFAENTRMATRSTFLSAAETHLTKGAAKGAFADAMNRGTSYTPPRTITLNTKFDGAIRIEVWSGFAVQVVNSKGDRRTVVGPKRVLLQYDENLERLTLSKGKPKNSDTRMNTAFLRYISNAISDIISLKTQDLVNVDIQIKYLVRFEEADDKKWFAVDNYVQYMVDHLRSLIGNAVRNIGVQEFYSNAANILRNTVLGAKPENGSERTLKHFEENGMTVYDLELITINVQDANIANLLSTSRQDTLTDAIELERQTQKLTLVKGQEGAKREIATELAKTSAVVDDLQIEQNDREASIRLAAVETENELILKQKTGEEELAKIVVSTAALYLERDKRQSEQEDFFAATELDRRIKLMIEEAAAINTRNGSIQPGLVEALIAMAQVGQFEHIAEYLAPLSIVRGESLSGTMKQMFAGTALEGMVDNMTALSKVKNGK